MQGTFCTAVCKKTDERKTVLCCIETKSKSENRLKILIELTPVVLLVWMQLFLTHTLMEIIAKTLTIFGFGHIWKESHLFIIC